MDIGQAVRRLQSGDKVRRESWEDKDLYIDPEQSDDDADDPIVTVKDLLASDWEVYDG